MCLQSGPPSPEAEEPVVPSWLSPPGKARVNRVTSLDKLRGVILVFALQVN
jgi:hypothetical protein